MTGFKSQANKKLKNLAAIRKMVDGTHRTQTKTTHSFNLSDVKKKREIGERWIQKEDGITYHCEQFDGFVSKSTISPETAALHAELRRLFKSCPKETCTCTNPGRADLKMNTFHQMCMECVAVMETELKSKGEWEQYQKEKIKQNVLSFLRDLKNELKEYISIMSSKQTIVHETGMTETYDAAMTVEQATEKANKEYDMIVKGFEERFNEPINHLI